MSKKVFYLISYIFYLFFAFTAFAQIPPGQAITFPELEEILVRIADFFIFASVLLAVIAIIVSGIIYLFAGGDNTKVDRAKTWFKNGLLGALIILGVGVILQTIAAVVTREAFCRFRDPITGRCLIGP